MDVFEYVKQVSGVDLSNIYRDGDGDFVVNFTHIAGYSRLILFSNALFFVPKIINKKNIIRIPLENTQVELEQNSFFKAIFSGKNSVKISEVKDGATVQEFTTGVGQEVNMNGVQMHANNPKCNKAFVPFLQNLISVLKQGIMQAVINYTFVETLTTQNGKLKPNKFSWMGPQEVVFNLNNSVAIITNEDIHQFEHKDIDSITLEENQKLLANKKIIKLTTNDARDYFFANIQGNKGTTEFYNDLLENLQTK